MGQRERSGEPGFMVSGSGSLCSWGWPWESPGSPRVALSIGEEAEPSGCCLRAAPVGCDKWEWTKAFSVKHSFLSTYYVPVLNKVL